MRRRLSALIVASTIALLGASPVARANLIDNGTVTTDTGSGLQWLDLNVTLGLSFDQVVAPGGIAQTGGWRHATADEFFALVSSQTNFPSNTVVQTNVVPVPTEYQQFVDLQILLGGGVTSSFGASGINRNLRGFLDSPGINQNDFWLGLIQSHIATVPGDTPSTVLWWTQETTGLDSDLGYSTIGHWLVRESVSVVLVDQLSAVPPSNVVIVSTSSDFDTPFQIADGFELAVGKPAQITRVQWLGSPPLNQSPSGDDALTFEIRFFRQVEGVVDVLPLSGIQLGTAFSETATSHPLLTLYSAELSPPIVLPGDGSYFISIVANSPGTDSDWGWFFLDGPTMSYHRALDSQPWEERLPRSYSYRLFGGPVPPRTVEAGGPYAGTEGEAVPIAAVLDRPEDGSVAYLWSVSDARCAIADPTAASTAVTCADDGSYTLTVTVSDGGASVSDDATLKINNAAPHIEITAPETGAVLPISTAVQVMASLSDAGGLDHHTCTIDFGDGTSEPAACDTTNGVTASPHTYAEAGVYEIWVTAADDDGGVGYESVLVVIYDPSAGFVTGGGWIDSPAGAYAGDAALTGRANFGFVSRYKKGADVPDGNTQFVFQAGALNFHSSAYQWLTVAGGKAQFKGLGTVNGFGNYGFLIFATDAEATSAPDDLDTFRIKIWDRDKGDEPVYDNGAEQAIGGGSIVVHTGRDR